MSKYGTIFPLMVLTLKYQSFFVVVEKYQDFCYYHILLKTSCSSCYLQNFLISQFSSVTQSCPTLCNPMNCSTPGLPIHHQLPEFTQTHVIELVMPSSHLILSRPLFLLRPIPPSIRGFSNESTLHMR